MNTHGLLGSITASSGQAVKPVPPQLVAPGVVTAPSIGSTQQAGVAVTYTSGTYSGNPLPTVTRQWLLDGSTIVGATGATYTPLTSDAGAGRLSVRETATNGVGSNAVSTSSTVNVNSAPAVVTAPSIIGSATVGVALSYTAATFTGFPAPTVTRQWLLDGGVITGATSATYTPAAGDVGTARLSVRETASNGVGSSAVSTSSAVSVAASGSLGTAIASFSLTSSVGGSNLPFTIGHSFKQGDVAAGAIAALGGDTALQIKSKNTWPDGSLKFAVVSGRRTLSANTPSTLTLYSTGVVSGGAALTTADLKATGIVASIDCGGFGTVSWATTDWDAPAVTWVSGPGMSSWIYRKAVGSDAHLVGLLEVRLYAGGAVDVVPYIENGYVTVASPTNKSATYAFSLGGTQRFSAAIDLKHHQRTVLLSGTGLSHWLGTDPDIRPAHDKAYMMATRMVPTYTSAVSVTAPCWTSGAIPTTFAPLQQGGYSISGSAPDDMTDTGYHAHIGMLPEWDVVYLCSTDARAYGAVVRNGYSAGRYCIHYRDSTASPPAPIKFSAFPTKAIRGASEGSGVKDVGGSDVGDTCPAVSGGAGPIYDSTHAPSIGFFAYLLTGRHYFMEETQFSATIQYLKQQDTVRQNSKGIFDPSAGTNTPRGMAWALRTMFQAACATPDGDALQTEFVNCVSENVIYNHGVYVAQANCPLGFTKGYGSDVADYGNQTSTPGTYGVPVWQDHWITGVHGWALDIVPGLSATNRIKLQEFFAYKCQVVIGMLGGLNSEDFNFRDAGQYISIAAPSSSANFDNGTGPWYASWGAMHQALLGTTNPGNGALQGSSAGDPAADPPGYWQNMTPAISYAVRHGIPGALTAYARLVNASNYSSTIGAQYSKYPVWSLAPPSDVVANVATPTWLSGKAINEGVSIASTRPDSLGVVGNGMAFNYSGGWNDGVSQLGFWGGGRADCNKDNSVPIINLLANAPAWSRAWGPTPDAQTRSDGSFTWNDGAPGPRHSYGLCVYDHMDKALHIIGGAGPVDQSANTSRHDTFTFSLAAAGSFPWSTLASAQAGYNDSYTAADKYGNLYILPTDGGVATGSSSLQMWKRLTNTWSNLTSTGVEDAGPGVAYDPVNHRIFKTFGSFTAKEIDLRTGAVSNVTIGGASIGADISLVYDIHRGRYVARNRATGSLYDLVRNSSTSYTATQITVTGTSCPGANAGGNLGPMLTGYNRFVYLPALRGIAHVRDQDENVWFMRTA